MRKIYFLKSWISITLAIFIATCSNSRFSCPPITREMGPFCWPLAEKRTCEAGLKHDGGRVQFSGNFQGFQPSFLFQTDTLTPHTPAARFQRSARFLTVSIINVSLGSSSQCITLCNIMFSSFLHHPSNVSQTSWNCSNGVFKSPVVMGIFRVLALWNQFNQPPVL